MKATPEQVQLARRIDETAQRFVDDAIRTMKIIGAPPELQRIILEALARKALRVAGEMQ